MAIINRLPGLFLALGVMLVAAMGTLAPAEAAQPKFCWKDTTTRGVGQIPATCAPGKDRIGLLCYDKCDVGMERVGFDCHSVCPAGMEDQGLFCRRTEYGRGAGYPWKIGDPLNNSAMFARCEHDHGRNNCEKVGLIVYPKCKPGYTAFGCCICRPDRPNCAALGLNPGVDLSCAKKVEIVDPELGICGKGQQRDAGLCYPNCSKGFAGVGPVCWGKVPAGWVDCGMGAAKDKLTCASIITGQVIAVGQLAMNVATLGGASGGGSLSPGKLAQLKAQFDKLKAGVEKIKNIPRVKKAITVAENLNRVRKGYNIAQTLNDAVTVEDRVRAAAQVAAILDPTGVAGTVAAYTYPKCSKYFPTMALAPDLRAYAAFSAAPAD